MARNFVAMLRIAIVLFSIEAIAGQMPGEDRFEVASVRVATADRGVESFIRGGPGTSDPIRITCQQQFLSRLIYLGYGLDFDQISGPSWIGTEMYTVVANVRAGATADEVKAMWRNLLKERFHFEAHFIKKEFTVYQLNLSKGGPQMQSAGARSFKPSPDFPEPRDGHNWAMARVPPRTVRMTFRNSSIEDLINRIKFPLSELVRANEVAQARIIDKTGLNGKYDFTLEFAGSLGVGGAFPPVLSSGEKDTAPLLEDALRQQLGIELRRGKEQLDVLVVDHADRVPVEN